MNSNQTQTIVDSIPPPASERRELLRTQNKLNIGENQGVKEGDGPVGKHTYTPEVLPLRQSMAAIIAANSQCDKASRNTQPLRNTHSHKEVENKAACSCRQLLLRLQR